MNEEMLIIYFVGKATVWLLQYLFIPMLIAASTALILKNDPTRGERKRKSRAKKSSNV